MGLIRVLLALAVVDFHAVRFASSPHFLNLPWINGGVAVQSFFVISGFYMALILSGKYAGRGVFVFYRARFLRLYSPLAARLEIPGRGYHGRYRGGRRGAGSRGCPDRTVARAHGGQRRR
jgi:hypothetical protein